jgi:hypothetical protein
MVQAFVLSLICGPAAVTPAFWLLSATLAARSQKETVVRVMIDRPTRSSSPDPSRRHIG